MIKRLQAYREDRIKVSELLVRLAAIVSHHQRDEFGLDETQTEAIFKQCPLTDDGFLQVDKQHIERGYEVVERKSIFDD